MMIEVESRVSAAPATLEWWAILLIVLGSIAVGIPVLILIPGGLIGGAITGLVFLIIALVPAA
jgi:hypothetical protein